MALRFGLHRTTVAGWLREAGVELRRQGLSAVEMPEVIRLYAEGWSCVRLGERFGCDHETVRQALKRQGEPPRVR